MAKSQRTALFSQKQPGGVFDYQSVIDHPNNIFFVGSTVSGASDTAGFGYNPDAPMATLDYAVAKCVASLGDTIVLMPGHAETKSVTGSLFALDVAGIRVIGLGEGADRPTFTFSHTGAAATWSAASIHLENVVLVTGIDSVLAPLTISAADWSLIDVEHRDTSDVEAVVGVVTTAAADRGHVSGFYYNGYTGGDACTIGISLVGVNGCLIENSHFSGEFSTGCIDFTTTLCTDIVVKNCTFYNDNVALTKNVVDSATSSIWQVTDCWDGKGGYTFSGGSSSAVASDDIGTLAALVGTSAESTQTSDLHGKIGTDAEMDNKSLYDLLVGDGPTTAPASAAPGAAVSLYEVASAIYDDTDTLGAIESTQTSDVHGKIGTDTQMDDKSLFDLLVGDGPTTAPASAAPGAAVSVYEVISAIYDDTDVIGAIGSTQTSDLHGKVGTDTEMGDRSLYDLLNGSGPVTAATGATAAAGVSIYGVTRYIEQTLLGAVESTQTSDLHGKIGTDAEMDNISLYDLLVGAGPSTAPAGAAAADDVSLYEVTRYIQETLLGAVESTQTSDLHGKIGTDAEMNNISVYDLLVGAGPTTAPIGVRGADDVSLYEVARYAQETQEQCIVKTDGACLVADDPIFDVSGGPVLVTGFFGIVTDTIGANVATFTVEHDVTAPANTVALSTTVAVTDDAIGTSYHMTVATPGVFTDTTNGAFDQVPAIRWFLPIGQMTINASADNTGVIAWYMTYKPLSPLSVVTAAT